MNALPDGLLLSFYGDDYTGSSAVMEAMSFAGLPTVLFLQPPTPDDLARFAGYRGIGIAGTARARDPEWMAAELPPLFRTLAHLQAPIAQYKVCSTFDSAPNTGSIGRAIELAAPLLGSAWTPLVVASPAQGRYQAFGNLFAIAGGAFLRLDRHPTMARHPVTPMAEADVRRHLAAQTDRAIGLIDIVALKTGAADRCLAEALARGETIIAIDLIDQETLAAAGRLIWQHRGDRLFAVGSQGLEYALIAHWRSAGLLPDIQPRAAEPVALIAAVSASCAPETAAQIRQAECHGFATMRIDPALAVDPSAWEREIARAAEAALAAFGRGLSTITYTALGPDDPAIAATSAAIQASGIGASVVSARIGTGLGRLLDRVMREGGVRRGVIAGGDTSGQAAEALRIRALTAIAPIVPGAPLCRVHGEPGDARERELILKGGQMGGAEFFSIARSGGAAKAPSGRAART